MAHYAFLDDNNVVTEVIVGKNEGEEGINWELRYGSFRNQVCKRTSYNTRGGIHYDQTTNEPSADQSKVFRKNYAGIGYTYDQARDAFIPPKPFNSWVLNDTTCLWDPPTPMPEDGKIYVWNEETTSWQEVTE
jgi:hypothetical protein